LPAIAIRHPSNRERAAGLTLLGTALLLKLPYLANYRFNSDEPQHLHVVWGWTRGLVQYRDLFDNHSPLFHLVMVPWLALVGERADALVLMRVPMLALYALAVALTYLLARRLYDARVALFAAVLLGLHYEFFFTSTEFRTDNLWTVLWLAALALLAGGPLDARRAFAAAAALGAALAVSQKTALLLAALVAAALVVAAASAEFRAAFPPRRAGRLAAAAAAGLALVPALVAAFLAAHGALAAAVRDVVAHNVVPGLGHWGQPWRWPAGAAAAAAAAWVAARSLGSGAGDGARARRVLVFLTAALYVVALEAFWPLVTGQDNLPAYPLAAIAAAAALQRWQDRRAAGGRSPALPAAVLAAWLAAELGVIVGKGPIWRDRGRRQTALVADVLRLTGPGDYVFDAKGETVFRRRAFFPVLETITKERIRRGLLPDTIAESVVRTRCHVAAQDNPGFPARGRAFLDANFVSVGALRVAGRRLDPAAGAGAPVRFAIAVPGRYVVIAPGGAAAGALDGVPGAGPRELGAGTHEFTPAGAAGPLAVVWARAVECGLSPFAAHGRRR
jgi:Dolichyl-phosphate-mannose-protein mannosyltransferase